MKDIWHDIWRHHTWQEYCRSRHYITDDYLNAIDEVDEINHIMRCIPSSRDRAIFVLWAIDDYSFTDISQMFSMTAERVRQIVSGIKDYFTKGEKKNLK